MDLEKLQILIDSDELGLLNVKPKVAPISTDDRLVNSFEEINTFIDKNGRAPELSGDILENALYYRLTGILENPKKIEHLKMYDRHNLLNDVDVPAAPKAISDILVNDDLGLLSVGEKDIFNLRPELQQNAVKSPNTPEDTAKHKKCVDFDKFEPLFRDCQADLKSKKRFLKKFATENSIQPGNFFVLKGVLLYIDQVGEFTERNTRLQARLRCIYENGTESNVLRNSLAKALYSDGRIVTENIDNIMDGFTNINKDDKPTGYIYVLKSLSRDPKITSIDNLYKIGYSETGVEDRIKNAHNEPTYLMAKVKPVATYKMYNTNTQKFEDLLHRFFRNVCISIDVIDNNGSRHTPREWFQAPIEIIQQTIALLQTGEIVNYMYSREEKSIVEAE